MTATLPRVRREVLLTELEGTTWVHLGFVCRVALTNGPIRREVKPMDVNLEGTSAAGRRGTALNARSYAAPPQPRILGSSLEVHVANVSTCLDPQRGSVRTGLLGCRSNVARRVQRIEEAFRPGPSPILTANPPRAFSELDVVRTQSSIVARMRLQCALEARLLLSLRRFSESNTSQGVPPFGSRVSMSATRFQRPTQNRSLQIVSRKSRN
jgi:hypothetical protein